jgi:hypothetical protein
MAVGMLKKLWRIYAFICVVFCTLGALYILYALIHYHYRYVALPNGVSLHNVAWSNTIIVLKDADGEVLVGPNVMEIVWNDHYVRGRRLVDHESIDFIHKIGAPLAVYNTDEGQELFTHLAKESRLETSEAIGASTSRSTLKTYLDLIEDPRYRRLGHLFQ